MGQFGPYGDAAVPNPFSPRAPKRLRGGSGAEPGMLPSITLGVPKDFGTPPKSQRGRRREKQPQELPAAAAWLRPRSPPHKIRFAPPQLELVSPQPHPIKAPGGAPPQPQIKALTVGMGTSPDPAVPQFPFWGQGDPRGGAYLPVGTRLLEHPTKKKNKGEGALGGHGDGVGATVPSSQPLPQFPLWAGRGWIQPWPSLLAPGSLAAGSRRFFPLNSPPGKLFL